MQRFTPAYYREGSPSRHPIPFPGFQAAYRAQWPMEPVATCLLDRTHILDAIYTGRRHEAVKKTVDLFVEAILIHLRRDEKRPLFWFVVVPDEVYEYGRPNSSIPTQLRRRGSVTISRRRAARLQEAPDLFEDFNAQAHVFEYHNDFRRQLKGRLIQERVAVPAILAAVGLAHDLGNPPFGHQSELAIQSWVARNQKKYLAMELRRTVKA
jgi:hypothetical protein